MFRIMLLAAAATTLQPSPSSPAPNAQTPQALFDQATKAAAQGECAQAVDLFQTLEQRKVLKVGSMPESATAVRKGYCLVRLNRVTEGEEAIRRGLPVLEKAGPSFNRDVADARETLGVAALSYQDYDAAVSNLQRSLALREGLDRLKTLGKLAQATAFDGDQASLGYAQEGIDLIMALPPKDRNKDSLAAFHALRARTLLNQGKVKEGYTEAKQSLAFSGGLTSQTSLAEASMRADLGMAAALAGHMEEARLALAYTGAGRIRGARFERGLSMDPPPCGEETGLRPEDVAVVEFAIADSGAVDGARTVYSRGNRAVAAAFANAVNGWYWSPDKIKAIPVFYRANARIELRCSVAGADAPSVGLPAFARFMHWATPLLPATGGNGAGKIETLRTWLAANEASATPLQRAAVLGVVASSDIGLAESRVDAARRAIVAATEGNAPVEAINWLRIVAMAPLGERLERSDRANLRALAADPAFAGDPLASATALMLSTLKSRGAPLPEASGILQQVANESRLPEHDPLRQAARLALANLASAAGDGEAAQRYFAATGLTEQQCALVGIRPAMRVSGASSTDYPAEALRMGFEGWVNLEFDVTADGRAVGARPIVAYPPLIFVDTAQGMSKNFRYQASYRPGGGAACSANRETVNFITPE